MSSLVTGSSVPERAVTQTSADLDGQDGWTVVKKKSRGRRQAGTQYEKLGDSRAKAKPRAPLQRVETETQPVEPLKTTQEAPPPSLTTQRRHLSRRKRWKRRHTEQQEAEDIQKQPGSEVESHPRWACQPYLFKKPCHPDDWNEWISAQRQQATIHLDSHPLDQLAASLQACLAISK